MVTLENETFLSLGMLSPARRRLAFRRIVDGTREISVLLLAFTPLEVTLSEGHHGWALLLFVVIGALLFMISLFLEMR